ncbi:MAG TPA: PQQ-binding-like beta-propeller repeat protein, partial [Vicinamibacterales bacterium]|nr:PQQ-binding-like beta-propeller repeat protein [Vicinamibacterales bacterium]
LLLGAAVLAGPLHWELGVGRWEWAAPLSAQAAATNAEWRTYGGSLSSHRYSPLDQISAANFSTLEVAWRLKTDNLGPRPEFNFQSTPLMIGGTLYTTAGSRRAVVALDAATGEMKWMSSLDEGKRGQEAPRQLSGRGLAYWSDGRSSRIIYVTPGYQMIALDAQTGQRITSFGKGGIVDLKLEDDQEMDPITGDIGLHAAPIIAKDVVIIGAAHTEGSRPVSKRNDKGYVRGFDVKTGKRLWIFHTIPRPGEMGYDTWEQGSEEYTGNNGVWGQMSADEELGLVFLPTEMPTGDYYGGHRPGKNLFSDSLVALDLKTGKRKWHYQFIEHDIWDWDLPCAPIIADVTIDGRLRKIIAQPTKQGWLYVFDRVTGQPIWPFDERKVEASDVPMEKANPTQKFVVKPPAYDRQGVAIDDLIDYTPELRAEAVKLVSRFKIGPIFTPPVVSKFDGPLGTLMLPAATGGANWQGGSFDPETGVFYIFTNTEVTPLGLVPGAERPSEPSDMAYVRGQTKNPADPKAADIPVTVQGLPLIKPPYGRITALDLKQGTMLWQIAHGETPDNIRNHPALKGLTIPRTGRQGRIGTLVTKTLVIAGEGGTFTLPDGRRGAMLRAYNKATGQEVGSVYMPASQTGSPMTYSLGGQQYIVVAIAGPGFPGELIAFKLPKS